MLWLLREAWIGQAGCPVLPKNNRLRRLRKELAYCAGLTIFAIKKVFESVTVKSLKQMNVSFKILTDSEWDFATRWQHMMGLFFYL